MKNSTNGFRFNSESLSLNKLLKLNQFFGLILCLIGLSLTVSAASSFLDLSFGSDGKVVSSPDGSEQTSASGMALQADGKIVMVGGGAHSGTDKLGFIVVRYNADGSLDTTFGNNGLTVTTFGTDSARAASVDIQPDGKIVVGGKVSSVVNNDPVDDFGIARFNSDGSLDTTFDGDGKATVSFHPEVIEFVFENLNTLKIAPDGKIVVAGQLRFFPDRGKFGIARLNADGSLDTAFGTSGRVVSDRSGFSELNDLTVLPDGSMVAVGRGFGNDARIAEKYNVSGGLEWRYVRVDGQSINAGFYGVAAQADGKLVAVGIRLNRVFAIRLNADGTEDSSFNTATVTPGGLASAVAIQADGKIVANFNPDNSSYDYGNSFNLIRYNADGTLDSGFGVGGKLYIDLTSGFDFGKKILIQPDAKILVGGYSSLILRPDIIFR